MKKYDLQISNSNKNHFTLQTLYQQNWSISATPPIFLCNSNAIYFLNKNKITKIWSVKMWTFCKKYGYFSLWYYACTTWKCGTFWCKYQTLPGIISDLVNTQYTQTCPSQSLYIYIMVSKEQELYHLIVRTRSKSNP